MQTLIEIRRLTISAFKQLRCIHFTTRNLFEIFSFIPIGYWDFLIFVLG